MNKLTKSIVTFGLALAITTPIFAQVPTKYPVSVDLKAQFAPTAKYVSSTEIVDKYGNLVSVTGKWEGKFSHFIDQTNEKKTTKTVTATRDGYKPATFPVTFPQDKKVVIESSTTKQITMGKVIIPNGLPKDNWWIKVQNPDAYQSEVILKVKEDGTFKFFNLPNGAYDIEIFRGTHFDSFDKNATGCMWDKTHTADFGMLEIKGNINKTFDLTNKVTEQLALADYFTNTIDYANPSKYLNITQHLELDEATKKFADEKVPSITDVASLEKALGAIRTKFQFKFDAKKTDLDLTAQEIIKQGYLTGCTQTATIAQAILEYKGIPTTIVECVDVDWANQTNLTQSVNGIGGHAYIEAFVGNEWVLIDPTGGGIFTTYTTSEPVLYSNSDSSLKLFYAIVSGDDASAFSGLDANSVRVLLALKGNIKDLNNLPIIKPTSKAQINE